MKTKIRQETQKSSLKGNFRNAVLSDARSIQQLVRIYADEGKMLPRSLNELFETIRQYTVYEEDGKIIACCGLYITWEDLAEVRALAVDKNHLNKGIGSKLVGLMLLEAKRLGVNKVFTLTYIPSFFKRLGFIEIDKSEFPNKIWSDCIRCHKFPDCDEVGLIINVD